MQHRKRWPVLLLGALTVPHAATAAQPAPNARRAAVVRAIAQGAAGLPALKAAMKDENVVVRRAAVRGLTALGTVAREPLGAALKDDSDPLVRRTALRALLGFTGSSNDLLAAAFKDPSDMVRLDMVNTLVAQRPRTPEVEALIKQAQKDPSPEVSRIATSALWPFYKLTISARERPDTRDNQLKLASAIPLPLTGWRFHTDPRQDGHLQNWHTADFDDSKWDAIEIGKAWEESGHVYDGVAWYRGSVTLPEKPAVVVGVDLHFESVDESAWVWVNGQYAGQHDIGPDGWDKAFRMEVTNLLKWGQPNQITVRVLDRKFAGGIYKPVTLEVLTR